MNALDKFVAKQRLKEAFMSKTAADPGQTNIGTPLTVRPFQDINPKTPTSALLRSARGQRLLRAQATKRAVTADRRVDPNFIPDPSGKGGFVPKPQPKATPIDLKKSPGSLDDVLRNVPNRAQAPGTDPDISALFAKKKPPTQAQKDQAAIADARTKSRGVPGAFLSDPRIKAIKARQDAFAASKAKAIAANRAGMAAARERAVGPNDPRRFKFPKREKLTASSPGIPKQQEAFPGAAAMAKGLSNLGGQRATAKIPAIGGGSRKAFVPGMKRTDPTKGMTAAQVDSIGAPKLNFGGLAKRKAVKKPAKPSKLNTAWANQ